MCTAGTRYITWKRLVADQHAEAWEHLCVGCSGGLKSCHPLELHGLAPAQPHNPGPAACTAAVQVRDCSRKAAAQADRTRAQDIPFPFVQEDIADTLCTCAERRYEMDSEALKSFLTELHGTRDPARPAAPGA